MTCTQCSNELICRLKDYGGNFPPSLQWQNYNGTAHYKTTDGKNFSCNVPDEEEKEQTRISSESATTPETQLPPTKTSSNLAILNAIDDINLKFQRMDEMIQAIFRYTVDEQLKKK